MFQSLKGVVAVEQGFVASTKENNTFSEAVIVHFKPETISISVLIEIHLLTHKSTSQHTMRKKYRSAIYIFSETQNKSVLKILETLQLKFDKPFITKVLPFKAFKTSQEQFKNYYLKNPEKPFCKTYIEPKLKLLLNRFSYYTNN